jgi:hypothetical protein
LAQDLRESNSSSQASGYHGANAAIEENNMLFREETASALANLATATASDRSTLAANAEIVSLKRLIPKSCQHTPFGDGNRF